MKRKIIAFIGVYIIAFITIGSIKISTQSNGTPLTPAQSTEIVNDSGLFGLPLALLAFLLL